MNPYKILLRQQKKRKPHNPDLPTVIKNKKEGSILVLVPGGEFLMGSDPDRDLDVLCDHYDEQPQHLHYLPDYYIGIYAVTNRQYSRFVRETGHPAPDEPGCGTPVWKDGKCPKDKLDHPVMRVWWEDARAYCKWADLMLPTEAMWEKAARGCDGRIYPWGDEWDESMCRNDENMAGEGTCVVWGYPEGIGPNRIYQSSGNVWEWCNDRYEERAYRRYDKLDYSQPKTEAYRVRVLRGGSWHCSYYESFRCGNRGYVVEWSGDWGFRPSKLVIP